MSDDVTAEALRMACREIAQSRSMPYADWTEADVDDVVQEFLEKATGFGSEEAT